LRWCGLFEYIDLHQSVVVERGLDWSVFFKQSEVYVKSRKIVLLGMFFGLFLSANVNADWFGGDDCPPWEYDCNDWPEWTPMYWMEEMSNEWDDDDDYYRYGGYGMPYGGGYGMPYGGGYGMPYGGGYGMPYGGGYGMPYGGGYGMLYGGGYGAPAPYGQVPAAPAQQAPAQQAPQHSHPHPHQ